MPFVIAHLSLVAMFWTGISWWSFGLAVSFYLVRMWGVTAGYHRYFSHRTFRTTRVGQFLLAVLAQSSAQRGAIWWAAKHRAHHKYSDTPSDPHSPLQQGFWFAHMGWIFARSGKGADYSHVRDLTKFPELVWLNKHDYFVSIGLGAVVWWFGGWEGLVAGYMLSTVMLFHGTFMINSLAHVMGNQRYVTGDDSRNNWLLAIITLGEGWHNNHHHFQSSTRQGFRWYEYDVTFYVLKLMSWVGLVWDLKAPPAEVVLGETRLRGVVIEKVAQQLAESFSIEAISADIREAWDRSNTLEELAERAADAFEQAQAYLDEVQMPQLPSLDELHQRALEMYTSSPSMDDITERAREIILEGVSFELFEDSGLMPA
jgi:stearoyl-CoA desaturase (delta-9 desaturase)